MQRDAIRRSAGEPGRRDDGVHWDGDAARLLVRGCRPMGAVEDRSVGIAECVTLLERAFSADALGIGGSVAPERQARRDENRADKSLPNHRANRSESPSLLSLIASEDERS